MSLSDMTPERRREVAAMGGKSLQPRQRSFSQNRELARAAGKKGGLTPKRSRSKLSIDNVNAMLDVADVSRETVAIEP